CEFILTYIYKLKKARQNEATNKFDHAIIVDEAHNIFLKRPTNFSNESVTDMIYREMREYGTSLICLDQHISKISDTVKGNSACHIAFQQQLPQDIEDISGIMQLRDKRQYFSQLPVGSAIVKLSERFTSPFLIEVPFASIRDQKILDADVKSRMDAIILGKEYEEKIDPEFNKAIENPKPLKKQEIVLNDSPKEFTDVQKIIYQFVKEYLANGVELKDIEKILEQSKTQGKYTSEDIIKVINKTFENSLVVTFKNNKKPIINTNVSDLTDDQRKFTEFLQVNPTHTLSTTEVYRKIGLSARKGTQVKKELEEKGLIKIEEGKYPKGWKKFIRLA
ncbi:MAG: zonular occludens toxin domain-containing protein, partial [Candidatus Nanoarchaeia archaeon]